MKCGFLGLMVMCWVGLQSYAQGPDFWQFEGLDTLYRKVKGFGVGLPQEKAYLHLDNTCYFLGDTIWYKGYVTRSDRGTLTDLSKILYVELLTPDGYSVERQQLEMEDGTAHGMFVLKDTLYAGYYELGADDYVTKPFPMSVFQRICSTARRWPRNFSGTMRNFIHGCFPCMTTLRKPGILQKT